MTKVVAVFCLFILLMACESDNDLLQCNVKLELKEHSPHSLWLTVEGSGLDGAKLEFVNQKSGEVLALTILNGSSGSLLVNKLIPGNSIDYLVRINGDVVESGLVNLPELPKGYAEFTNVIFEGVPDLNGGYLLVNKMSMPSGIFLIDAAGEVVWSRLSDNFVKMVKLTERGTLLTIEDNLGDKFGNGNLIYETTFTSDTLVELKYGVAGFDRMAHHDVVLTNRGTYAFITNVHVDGLIVDGITELNAYGEKVWEWDMASHVLPVKPGEVFNQPWGNSIEVTANGHYLISFRALSQVWKIDAFDGKVLMKFGGEHAWGLAERDLPLFQHHAQIVDNGNLLLFDNGGIKERAFSRLMQYGFSNNDASVNVVNEVVLPQSLFSPYMSAVQIFDQGYLLTSSMTHQVAHVAIDGNVNWSMQLGDRLFRAQLVNVSFN